MWETITGTKRLYHPLRVVGGERERRGDEWERRGVRKEMRGEEMRGEEMRGEEIRPNKTQSWTNVKCSGPHLCPQEQCLHGNKSPSPPLWLLTVHSTERL